MAGGDFTLDIVVGGDGELLVKRILENKLHFTNIEINTSKNYRTLKAYDITAVNKNGQKVYFEVKNDFKSVKTGNIAIEFECNGLPSGINSTTSDFCVYIGLNEVYIIKTKKLREIIDRKLYFRTVSGGDGNLAKMYLFKKSVIKEYSLVINI